MSKQIELYDLQGELGKKELRFHALDGKSDRTADESKELEKLDGEIREVREKEIPALAAAKEEAEAAIVERTESTPENRELRELRSKAGVSDFVGAAVAGRGVGGASLEYSQALGCGGDLPIDMLKSPKREVRADTATAAPSSGLQTTPDPIAPAAFQRSVAAYLGIAMPVVDSGVRSYPVVSTSLTASGKAKGGKQDSTAGIITANATSPKRITGRLTLRREDMAVLPDIEDALTENLSLVILDKYDDEVLNGTDSTSSLAGVLDSTTAKTVGSTVVTFASALASVADQLDGLWANALTDVAVLVGVETLKKWESTWRSNQTEMTVASYLRNVTGGLRAAARFPAAASDNQAILFYRNAPAMRTAVSPMWRGVQLVRDEFSSSGSGEVHVTAILLCGGVALLHPAAYQQGTVHLA